MSSELDRLVSEADEELKAMSARMNVEFVPCSQVIGTFADGSDKYCGKKSVAGVPRCRQHGGSLEIVSAAAAAIRMEAARQMIVSELADATVRATNLYFAVMDDDNEDTKHRLAAADRVIALAGGADALINGSQKANESGPVAMLREMLAATNGDKLQRLAMRLNAIEVEAIVTVESEETHDNE